MSYRQSGSQGRSSRPFIGLAWGRWCLSGVALLLVLPAQAQSVRDEIGWTSLLERLGREEMPDGRGVRVGQVEVGVPGEYAPGVQHPELAGLPIRPTSGPSAPSQHATRVGSCFYGRDGGVAPGVLVVEAWEVLDWLGAGFLGGAGGEPPRELGVAVWNHSWVGDLGPESGAYLRKLDAAIAEQGMLVVSGTANGAGRLAYPLIAQAYNGISVGRADGWHAAGETLSWIDGPGRSKPELVAPAPATSYAAPLVAGAAALLIQTAREHPRLAGNPRALRPDVLKAVLMAGARHRPGWANSATEPGGPRGATDRPLDPLFGVDLLDVDTSHWVLTAGEAPSAPEPSDAPIARPSGWVRLEVAAGESQWVRVRVERGCPFASVVATWNRRVTPGFEAYELPDIDLELYALGPQGEPTRLVGEAGVGRFAVGNVLSNSRVDNVEHLFLEGLAPGDYLMQVRRGAGSLPSWPVALAWRFSPPTPHSYGVAKATSLGSEPVLSAPGLPESFGAGIVLELTGGIPFQTALLLESHEPDEAPMRGGTMLVRSPVERSIVVRLDARGSRRVVVDVEPSAAERDRHFQVLLHDPHQPDGSGVAHSAGLTLTGDE